MPNRTITGTVLAADLAAYPGKALSFYLAESFIDGGITYLRSETEVTPNQTTGVFSISVAVPTTPTTAIYRIRMITDEEYWVNITEGAPIDLATLVTIAASPIAQSALITVINDHKVDNSYHSYNVKNYGAKGDNITDDTAAIQAAIDALPVRGGIIYMPPGTYEISAPINLDCWTILAGTGYEGTLIEALPTFAGTAMIQNRLQDGTEQMVAVRDMMLDGKKATATVPIGILFKNVGQISHVRDVYIYQCSGNGLVFSSTAVGSSAGYYANNISVDSCDGDNIVIEGTIQCVSLDTITSQFLEHDTTAIYLNGSGVEGHRNIWLRNIHIEGDPLAEQFDMIGIEINNMQSVLVDGVDFISSLETTGDLVKITGTSSNVTLRGLQTASLLNIVNDTVNTHIFSQAGYPRLDYYSTNDIYVNNITGYTQGKFGTSIINDAIGGIQASNGTDGFVIAAGTNGDLYLQAKAADKAIRMNQGDVYIANKLWHNGTYLGFYNHAMVDQQILATGAGNDADDIIAALQALGLVKQA